MRRWGDENNRRCHPERAKGVERSAPPVQQIERGGRGKTAEDTEKRSPGRAPCARARLLSIHAIKVFHGAVERSLRPHGAIRPFPCHPWQSAFALLGRPRKRPEA